MESYFEYIDKGCKAELVIKNLNSTARFFGTFNSHSDKEIVIEKLRSKEMVFDCSSKQTVELYIYTKNGIFKFECRYIGRSEDNYKFSFPTKAEKIQRRQYIRAEIKVKTTLNIYYGGIKKTIQGTSRNISAKGMNILLKENISGCSKLDATMAFPECNISTIAQIVKINPMAIRGEQNYSTSLVFISISEKEMNFIIKKCFEFEAAQRKKMLDYRL